ncbi:uncharacterized protein EI90DRAFT_3289357 [Cantharellus anzutake]|uniref:uncharacterized protein n=1 Tax=Cantharellus anzutake TaxID=1750568 RepID=UPI001906B3CA|nr:uncharacterized protein EI90DRAFT_3289357 [Cantharellus anzutake]KAF8331689.1 hypothetical protein EI90DRAFT_3289357 [Cantharellus anzutake]
MRGDGIPGSPSNSPRYCHAAIWPPVTFSRSSAAHNDTDIRPSTNDSSTNRVLPPVKFVDIERVPAHTPPFGIRAQRDGDILHASDWGSSLLQPAGHVYALRKQERTAFLPKGGQDEVMAQYESGLFTNPPCASPAGRGKQTLKQSPPVITDLFLKDNTKRTSGVTVFNFPGAAPLYSLHSVRRGSEVSHAEAGRMKGCAGCRLQRRQVEH